MDSIFFLQNINPNERLFQEVLSQNRTAMQNTLDIHILPEFTLFSKFIPNLRINQIIKRKVSESFTSYSKITRLFTNHFVR